MHHIIRSADRAELVIADMTGNNPNVLYEIAVLDAMGRACVPVKLVAPNEKEDERVPFDRAQYRYFPLTLGDTQGAIAKLEPVVNNVLERQENGDFQENPLTDFFGFPLSSLSSAHGLARGYFRNFVLPVIQGEIIEPKKFKGVKDLDLECIIPPTVDLGTRDAVQDILKSGNIVPVRLQAPGREVNSYLWSERISTKPIIMDVPTAFGQLKDNIISRLGKSAGINPNSADFQEIQADEMKQFKRYLEGFQNKEPDSAGRRLTKYFRIIEVVDSRYPALFDDM